MEGSVEPRWLSGPVRCVSCGATWNAVRREDSPALECPKCGEMAGVAFFEIVEGEEDDDI